MPVTFGSVGDIIAVAQIVKSLLGALDDARGSAKEYQLVIEDLKNLEKVLLELNLLEKTSYESAEFLALGDTAKRIASECRALLEAFHQKIAKYNNRFDRDGYALAEAYWKLRWRVDRKESVEEFRTAVQARLSTITLLLVTAAL